MNPELALQTVSEAFDRTYEGQVQLPEETAAELLQFFRTGYERAVERDDIARFDDEVESLTEQLLAGAMLSARSDGGTQVDAASIREVIRRLCPIWPFC